MTTINPFEENRLARSKSAIRFFGGPADGEQMDIPNGVQHLSVDGPFGKIWYIRDENKLSQFILWDGEPQNLKDATR